MNRDEVLKRMHECEREYINHVYPPLHDGPFYHFRFIKQRKMVQDEFYAAMSYYESLLVSMPVLPLPATGACSTTTIVAPYTPAARRRPGRPRTGIKPRNRRVIRDDEDEYKP